MLDYHHGRYTGFPMWPSRQQNFQQYWHPKRLSPSLIRAHKVKRDRARMTEFILRKTAENMPFASLDNNEIVKLGTNTSLCPRVFTIRSATATVSTQTTGSVDLDAYNELKSVKESLERKNAELETTFEQFRSEINRLSCKIRTSDQTRPILQAELDKRGNKIKELEAMYRDSQTACDESKFKVTCITDNLSRARDEIVTLKRELSRMQKQQQEKQQALHNCESKLSRAQSEISDLVLELQQSHPPQCCNQPIQQQQQQLLHQSQQQHPPFYQQPIQPQVPHPSYQPILQQTPQPIQINASRGQGRKKRHGRHM